VAAVFLATLACLVLSVMCGLTGVWGTLLAFYGWGLDCRGRRFREGLD
jgi:hypothetical protein